MLLFHFTDTSTSEIYTLSLHDALPIFQTTEIYPYFKNELESLLKAVGFKKLDFYRNYNFEDYDKNGPDLIVVGEKRGVLKSKQAGKHSGASEKLERKPRSILGKVKQSTSE